MSDIAKPFVVCLQGPTAAGKTDIAVDLAGHLPVDIVSVDSAMVYRGMDIGTAKPDAATLARAPHRLIDIRDPWESYSAGDFCADASREISEIVARGRIPLLVGGTMMYFRALQTGLADLPQADPEVRAEINQRAARDGWPVLHAELGRLDPEVAARIKPLDAQRIQRALEVCYLTGKKMSGLQQGTRPAIDANFLNIGLIFENRNVLHQRIEQRFSQMVAAGIVGEVEGLLALPAMSVDAASMRAVGYRQLAEYVTGVVPRDEAIRRAVVATRRLAKRQLTWLRGNPDLQTVDALLPDRAEVVRTLILKAASARL